MAVQPEHRTVSIYKLWLGIVITALIAGAANWFTFVVTANVERAKMSEQISNNAADIADLTTLVRAQATSHAEFLGQLAVLTARLDAYLSSRALKDGGD